MQMDREGPLGKDLRAKLGIQSKIIYNCDSLLSRRQNGLLSRRELYIISYAAFFFNSEANAPTSCPRKQSSPAICTSGGRQSCRHLAGGLVVWLIMRRRVGHSRGNSIRKFLGGLTFVLKPPGHEALIERLHNDPYRPQAEREAACKG